MNLAELNKVAEAMVAPGKGILAADESSGTIKKRFDAIGVEITEDNRRDYREMLFRSDRGDAKHISGVILYDETIRQKAKDGTPLVKLIEKAGALPGIKVDKGTKPLPFCPGEVITEGLDGLRERLAEYRELGAQFAKWRAVIDIGAGIPSYTCINANAHALARYAALCQDGADRADRRAGSADGRRPRHRPLLRGHRMGAEGDVRGALLPARRARRHGAQAQHGDLRQEVREAAPASRKSPRRPCKLLKACVPAAVPGIAFLSGGQSDEEATAHLDAMNKIGDLPWKLTFSYGRALQARRRRPGPARRRTSPPRSAPSPTARA